MQKTEQNLKLLEKRIRELIHKVQEAKPAPKTDSRGGDSARYRGLPLLQGLEPSPSPELEKLLKERREVREGIKRIMTHIEQYLE